MGVFRAQYVTCSTCSKPFEAELAESINATRFPASREKILAGTLHRVRCPHCGTDATVEKAFNYIDLDRKTVFAVRPRQDRHESTSASVQLDQELAKIPVALLEEEDRYSRVVFGLAELREKLVAQDAGLDDRDVEMLKALVVYEHPFLVQRPRLRLHLTGVTDEGLEFRAGYEHDDRSFAATIPAHVAEQLDHETLRSWAEQAHGPDANIYANANHWVNMWRWSPANWALAMLGRYAATLRAGGQINLTTRGFAQMLTYLPRGNRLPAWAKRALRDLFEYVRTHGGTPQQQDALFEIRFDRGLEDEWSLNNDPNDIPTLWDLLKDLPDANVEGNVKLHEIFLDPGGGGWYEPGSGDIHIGTSALSNREGFQDVMRHEVGHAVHENNEALVNGWLTQRFGWKVFGADNAGVDAWVNAMGGWGAISATQQQEIRGYLIAALGSGSSWAPGPAPNPPAGHPWWGANFGPRLAYQNTGANWYNNHDHWFRHGNQAFFMNFWYRAFMVIDTSTLDLVNLMPSDYASMSHFEFFAEVYALFHDLDDPLRPNLPADVGTWLTNTIGAAGTGMPAPPVTPRPDEILVEAEIAGVDDVRRPAPTG